MARTGFFQRVLMAVVTVACGTSVAAAGIVDAGGVPDPTFAGLKLWLSGGSGVFTDAGVTPATDGQTVQQWNNLATAAGAASSASQGTAAFQPTFENGAGDLLGANPVVRFNGFSTYLDGTVTMGTDKTFFMVWKDTGTTGTCCSGGIGTRTGTDQNWNGLMSVRSGSDVRTFADFSGAGFAGNTNILGTPIIGTAVYQAGGTALYLNGALDGSNTADWGRAPTQYQVGTRNNEYGRYLKGDVAEILVYDGALSADDRKAIEVYLGAKYSIPTAYAGPLVDGEPNAAFAGLKLWLRSDTGVYTVADTTPAADGQTVAQWKNQALGAPANSSATGGAVANQPTFESSTGDLIGGHPVVRFDGIDDELEGTLAATAEKTIFAVMMDTGTQTTCCSGGVWTNGNNNALGTKNSGGQSRLNLDWSGSGRTGPTDITNQPIVAALTWNTTGSVYGQIFLNGRSEDIELTSRAGAASAYKLGTRGTDGPVYGRWFKGDYAEILIYDGQLGPVTRLRINQYLGAKYGIAVSGAVDEVMGSTAQVSTPANDPAFGGGSKVLAAVNFYNNTLGISGGGGPGDNGTVGSGTILGVGFDDIYVGAGAANGTFSLTANGPGVTLTTNMQNFSNREQSATIAGTDGATATRMMTDLKELTVGQTNELTFSGLGSQTELFVQLFGGDATWGADLDVYANGTLVGRWTSVADNNTSTASTYGFFTTADAAGQLLLRLDAINVGGPGNPNVAGLAGLIITMRVPEPSALVLALVGGVGLIAGGWRRRRLRRS